MLSRHELEEIIKAWPDKDGVSSNPEFIINGLLWREIVLHAYI